MATLLYITSNPKQESESVSLQIGRAFLNAYELSNPFDEIIKLDVYRDEIPLLDVEVFDAWAKMKESVPLSLSERKSWPESMNWPTSLSWPTNMCLSPRCGISGCLPC